MATITLNFSSLDETTLRAVLVAHHHEFETTEQPSCVQTSYAKEQNGGRVGCIVRVMGVGYEVTTMPMKVPSAAVLLAKVANADESTVAATISDLNIRARALVLADLILSGEAHLDADRRLANLIVFGREQS